MSKQSITLKDGRSYNYSTAFVNLENSIGVFTATLKQYDIYQVSGAEEIFIGSLYKTKEESWYDLPGNNTVNALLKMVLKSAIDEAETTTKVDTTN